MQNERVREASLHLSAYFWKGDTLWGGRHPHRPSLWCHWWWAAGQGWGQGLRCQVDDFPGCLKFPGSDEGVAVLLLDAVLEATVSKLQREALMCNFRDHSTKLKEAFGFANPGKLYFNSYLIIDISNVTLYQEYEKETWHLKRATSSLDLSWKKKLKLKTILYPQNMICSLLHLKTLVVIKSHAKAKVMIKVNYYCVCSPTLAWFPSQCEAHLLKVCKRKEKWRKEEKSRCVSTQFCWKRALSTAVIKCIYYSHVMVRTTWQVKNHHQ